MSEQTTTTAEPTAPAEAEATTEPQELGDGGKKALQAERDARKAADKAVAELQAKLKTFEDANKSELELAQQTAAEAQAQVAQLRAENIRKSVALTKGVPADLEEFLTGETEEEVAAKADLLMARLATPGTPKPDPSQGAKAGAHALGGDPLLDALKNKLGIN
jgi:aminopeptidase N